MRIRGSPAQAIAILTGAGLAAFAISTAAVSLASTHAAATATAAKYPFSSFSYTDGVSTARPADPATFSLTFTTPSRWPLTVPGS